MEYSASGDGTYTITCTSTGSPPTTVSWIRNEYILDLKDSEDDGKYFASQKVIDRQSSTYDNILTIIGSYGDAVGDYICNISNSLGGDSVGKTIDGIHHKIIV